MNRTDSTVLLATVATTLNERLALTAGELARSQALLQEASDELMTAFRGAADRIVAAQKAEAGGEPRGEDQYAVVLDHLYRAVQHLQSHDLVNQLIDAQKLRVEKMRQKLEQALAPGNRDLNEMLDCIIAGIRQIDDDTRVPRSDAAKAGSVDLF